MMLEHAQIHAIFTYLEWIENELWQATPTAQEIIIIIICWTSTPVGDKVTTSFLNYCCKFLTVHKTKTKRKVCVFFKITQLFLQLFSHRHKQSNYWLSQEKSFWRTLKIFQFSHWKRNQTFSPDQRQTFYFSFLFLTQEIYRFFASKLV